MKKKEFAQLKTQYFKALTKHKDKKALMIKKELFQAILERKANGKSLKSFNYH